MYIPFLLSLSRPNSTPLGHHRAQGWAPCVIQQLPMSYLFSPRQCVYVNVTFSTCPTLAVSTRPFSTSASPFLLCKQVHQYYFFRFHTYICINIQYLLFSFRLINDSLCITGYWFILLTTIDSIFFFLWLGNIPLYVLSQCMYVSLHTYMQMYVSLCVYV